MSHIEHADDVVTVTPFRQGEHATKRPCVKVSIYEDRSASITLPPEKMRAFVELCQEALRKVESDGDQ